MNEKLKTLNIENSQKKVVKIWFFIGLIGIFGLIYGFSNFEINSFDGGIIMISIFLIIMSIVCIFIFHKRAKALDKALIDRKFIAHFEYTAEEWSDFLEYEYRFRLDEKSAIFKLLSIITIPIFLLFILFIDEGKLAMFFVLIGLILMYAFMAFILPRIIFYFKKRTKADVIIMEKGVLLNKQFHSWDFVLSKFSSAKHIKKPYEHLQIKYEFWDRTGPRKYFVNIPIPIKCKYDISDIILKLKEANMK